MCTILQIEISQLAVSGGPWVTHGHPKEFSHTVIVQFAYANLTAKHFYLFNGFIYMAYLLKFLQSLDMQSRKQSIDV